MVSCDLFTHNNQIHHMDYATAGSRQPKLIYITENLALPCQQACMPWSVEGEGPRKQSLYLC